jgi:hypothetical protein
LHRAHAHRMYVFVSLRPSVYVSTRARVCTCTWYSYGFYTHVVFAHVFAWCTCPPHVRISIRMSIPYTYQSRYSYVLIHGIRSTSTCIFACICPCICIVHMPTVFVPPYMCTQEVIHTYTALKHVWSRTGPAGNTDVLSFRLADWQVAFFDYGRLPTCFPMPSFSILMHRHSAIFQHWDVSHNNDHDELVVDMHKPIQFWTA